MGGGEVVSEEAGKEGRVNKKHTTFYSSNPRMLFIYIDFFSRVLLHHFSTTDSV